MEIFGQSCHKTFWYVTCFSMPQKFLIRMATLNRPTRPTTSQISHLILEYLLRNPDAQDTVDGILHWWLLEQEVRHSVALIREALELLVSKDLVLKRQGQDMQTCFQINRNKKDEIMAFLKKSAETRPTD
jgi:Fe2+ or Zn2+ uptake regulation protein